MPRENKLWGIKAPFRFTSEATRTSQTGCASKKFARSPRWIKDCRTLTHKPHFSFPSGSTLRCLSPAFRWRPWVGKVALREECGWTSASWHYRFHGSQCADHTGLVWTKNVDQNHQPCGWWLMQPVQEMNLFDDLDYKDTSPLEQRGKHYHL